MAIVKDLKITVSGSTAKLSKDVYLYLGDGRTTLLIEVVENDYQFGTFKSQVSNVVTESDTVYAEVCVLKANNELVYSDRCQIYDGKIKFVIDKEFINEIGEKGTHLLQIHLFDAEDDTANRLTIPPVALNILQPICMAGDNEDDTP